MTRANDTLVDPIDPAPGEIPIYERPSFNFSLVVEGRPGGTNSPIGTSTFNWDPSDPTVLPYLLIGASRPLGEATTDVCDDSPSMSGGVPAIDSPDFPPTQRVADEINDFACRFKDGGGGRSGRGANDACTLFEDDSPPYHFVNPTGPRFPSTIQFCGQITAPLAFPSGDDTLITVRIRDLAGHVSEPARLFIRVVGP